MVKKKKIEKEESGKKFFKYIPVYFFTIIKNKK